MSGPIAFWKQALVALLIVVAAAAVWLIESQAWSIFGLPSQQVAEITAKSERRLPVIVETVRLDSDTIRFEAVGTGRALRSVTLRSEAEGVVTRMAIAPGAYFANGEPMLWLEDKNQRLALRLAETRLEEAQRTAERYGRLRQTGAATAARLDEARTAAEIARLEVERAQQALADRTLHAPFDGVTGFPAVEPGDWIDNAVAVVSFDDRTTLLVEFDLPEQLLSRVSPDMPVTATTPAFGNREFNGTVSAIDTRIDADSRTARVRVAISNEADLLRPGASFAVQLNLSGPQYPVVPELALQFSRGTMHVWRVKDDTAEKIEVALVRRRSQTVLVDGPLERGDLIVVEGTQRLAEDKPIKIIGSGLEAGS